MTIINAVRKFIGILLLLTSIFAVAGDEKYTTSVSLFREAGVGGVIDKAYGYAIFPNVGKGGIGIGGAYGEGRVFERGVMVGETSVTQVTVGFSAWGSNIQPACPVSGYASI